MQKIASPDFGVPMGLRLPEYYFIDYRTECYHFGSYCERHGNWGNIEPETPSYSEYGKKVSEAADIAVSGDLAMFERLNDIATYTPFMYDVIAEVYSRVDTDSRIYERFCSIYAALIRRRTFGNLIEAQSNTRVIELDNYKPEVMAKYQVYECKPNAILAATPRKHIDKIVEVTWQIFEDCFRKVELGRGLTEAEAWIDAKNSLIKNKQIPVRYGKQ